MSRPTSPGGAFLPGGVPDGSPLDEYLAEKLTDVGEDIFAPKAATETALAGKVDADAVTPTGAPISRPLADWLRDGNSPFINFRTDVNLKNWRKALARQSAGLGNARVACIGDSTYAGVGAGPSPGLRSASMPAVLARELTARGLAAIHKTIIGNANLSPASTYNPEVTFGSGWVASNVHPTAGGYPFYNDSTTNAMAWTPTGSVDTFEVYSYTNASLGTFSWAVDAGAATNVSGVGSEGIQKTTITTALGAHTLNLKRVSGQVYVAGIVAYDSTVKAVNVLNMGRGGSRTVDWVEATRVWNPKNAVPVYAPDLILLGLGINDYSWANYGTTTVESYKTNLQTLITAWKPTSDIVLVTPIPSQDTRQDLAIQKQFRDGMMEVALSNDLPVIDLASLLGLYADVAGLGFYGDTVHLTNTGYADMARAIAPALLV